jgi:hypothetical protein
VPPLWWSPASRADHHGGWCRVAIALFRWLAISVEAQARDDAVWPLIDSRVACSVRMPVARGHGMAAMPKAVARCT